MILAIDAHTFDSLSEPNQQGVKNAYPSLLLGVPAEYEDSGGKKWYVFSHSFPTSMIAKLASMTVNMSEMAAYDSPYVEDDGTVTDREALSDDLMDQLRNHVTHPIDEGPHDTPKAARDAQEPSDGALDGLLEVNPDMTNWSRVEPETV